MKKEIKIINRHRVVATGNPLLAVPYAVPQLSQRIIKLVIAHIDDERDEELHILSFPKKAMIESLGLSSYSAPNDALRRALKELRTKPISFETSEYEVETGWILKSRVWKYKDLVEIWMDDDLKPFLLDLRRRAKEDGQGFTKQILNVALSLRGEYSMKLFDLCSQYRWKSGKSKSGKWYVPEIPMGELRYLFGVDDENGDPVVNKEWREFRRKAIEPATLEVSKVADFSVDWTAGSMKGRKVLGVVFHCTPKDKEKEKALVREHAGGEAVLPEKELENELENLYSRVGGRKK